MIEYSLGHDVFGGYVPVRAYGVYGRDIHAGGKRRMVGMKEVYDYVELVDGKTKELYAYCEMPDGSDGVVIVAGRGGSEMLGCVYLPTHGLHERASK